MTCARKDRIIAWAKQTECFEALRMAFEVRRRCPGLESAIALSADCSRQYAEYVLKGRFLEGESVIKRDPRNAWVYAYTILKRRWPEAEIHIRQDSGSAERYAHCVIKGRWPEAEARIASYAPAACAYVIHVLKRRWPLGEAAINSSKYYRKQYQACLERHAL